MNENIVNSGASLEAYKAARENGKLAALLFLQSFEDHGDGMNHEEGGRAFAEVAIDEIASFLRSDSKEDRLGRIGGFMCTIGEALWWASEDRRQRAASAQHALMQKPKPARVVSLALVGAKKARAGKGAKDGE